MVPLVPLMLLYLLLHLFLSLIPAPAAADTLVEFAFGRPAFQSSTWDRGDMNNTIPDSGPVARTAVDGLTNQNGTSAPYCASTALGATNKEDFEPWW